MKKQFTIYMFYRNANLIWCIINTLNFYVLYKNIFHQIQAMGKKYI